MKIPAERLAGFRALRLVPGVGPATASRWLDALDTASDAVAAMRSFKAPLSAVEAWPSLIALYERLNASDSVWPAEFEELVGWYTPQLERIYDDAPMRLQDLAQLQNIAGRIPHVSVS